ncbi:MACPF domain-containing protein [Quillaja saponaria]|uniref:MACPF domain-containing protein n=1 Tax=Quillaja saponaria TaxID=32244 RepID=A0AAD7LAV1_QUISA|nr:MACPF domain-containing protein [Quillaja saponaria]
MRFHFIASYKVPHAFDVFGPQNIALNSFSSICAKDGLSVICFKRGGVPQINNHYEWLLTVPKKPDAIQFRFIPITSLLKNVPGRGFLSHAINLYLRYKPPLTDLQYFLDFQGFKVWAPIHNDLLLCPVTNRAAPPPPPSSALFFNLMGPKLYVNTSEVTVGNRPLTGLRLFLEGMKCNSRNKSSHVCTAPVKYDPRWTTRKDVAFIVTGAQLHIKKHDSRNVLHLQLLFSKVADAFVVQSNWTSVPLNFLKSPGIFSAISTSITGGTEKEKKRAVVVDSGVFPTGPPVPVQTQKLLKFVDMSHLCKGPQDSPGHWLVTGAKLVLEKGKIGLHVQFSLLSIGS